MMHNNRILADGAVALSMLLLMLFLQVPSAGAQEVSQEHSDSIRWEVNTLLNPFMVVLLGGNGEFGMPNPMGVQFKRLKGTDALRWHMEYDPSRATLFQRQGLGSLRGQFGDTLRLLNEDFNRHQFRIGMGYERGKMGRLGRKYVGADLSLTYRYTRLWSYETYYDLGDRSFIWEEDLEFNRPNPTRHLSAVGFGLKPFIGLERQLTEHLGFNLEAKLDFVLQYSEGYALLDDGRYVRSGEVLHLDAYPLLEVRLHYRF